MVDTTLPYWLSILFTVLIALLIVVILSTALYLYTFRRTRSGRQKSLSYLLISSIGLCFNVGSKLFDIWEFGFSRNLDVNIYIFQLGFALLINPLIVRIWRLVCVAGPTVDLCCNCSYGIDAKTGKSTTLKFWFQRPFLRKPVRSSTMRNVIIRRRMWLHLRLLLLCSPTFIIVIFHAIVADSFMPLHVLDLAMTVIDALLVLLAMLLTMALAVGRYRGALQVMQDKNESKRLIWYVSILFTFLAVNETLWYALLPTYPTEVLPIFLALGIAFVAALYAVGIGSIALHLRSGDSDAVHTTNALQSFHASHHTARAAVVDNSMYQSTEPNQETKEMPNVV
jgi:hypothetical protein